MVPCYLLVSDDASLLASARERTLNEVLAGDRTPLVRMRKGASLEEVLLARSLFSARAVVDIQNPTAGEIAVLISYLSDTDPEVCVVVSSSKPLAKLANAVKKADGVVSTLGSRGTDSAVDLVASSPVRFSAPARRLLVEHAGTDFSGLISALRLAETVFGTESKVEVDDIRPLLGPSGAVAPWVICDAIDAKDAPLALRTLERQLTAVPPVAVHAGIRAHIQRLFYAQNARCSADELGVLTGHAGPPFPLTKAVRAARSWGDTCWAMSLVAEAEADIKGGSMMPPATTLQVLVARLAHR